MELDDQTVDRSLCTPCLEVTMTGLANGDRVIETCAKRGDFGMQLRLDTTTSDVDPRGSEPMECISENKSDAGCLILYCYEYSSRVTSSCFRCLEQQTTDRVGMREAVDGRQAGRQAAAMTRGTRKFFEGKSTHERTCSAATGDSGLDGAAGEFATKPEPSLANNSAASQQTTSQIIAGALSLPSPSPSPSTTPLHFLVLLTSLLFHSTSPTCTHTQTHIHTRPHPLNMRLARINSCPTMSLSGSS